ncbi:hypothetical protein SOP86_23085 [Pseudomonas canadensis]|uniref:hypothetical protein n=1 Tax=Pseudomonas canadensis TaxID=915099 RepID=UPI002B24A749|nr:hypothetical protein [Pseudomonas canadensis]MEB2648526.1 hypothetical protein [Pseudomonas canadensis]
MLYKYHNAIILEKSRRSDEIIKKIVSESLKVEDVQDISLMDIRVGGEFCENCDACFDAVFNFNLILSFYVGDVDCVGVGRQKQAWRYSFLTDKAVHGLGDLSALRIDREPILSDKPLCYIDQNILTQAVNKKDILSLLLKIQDDHDIKIVCSVSHFEEIYKISDLESRQDFIDATVALTGEINLQPCSEDDRIKLFFENASITLSRVEMTSNSSEAVEMLKNLKDEDRRLYFEKYNNLDLRKKIGQAEKIFESLSDDEFSRLVCMSSPPGPRKIDFKGLTSHSSIRDAIYFLHNALDLISYKQDKSTRTQRSSAHDIEHLIYGSQCNYFITNDTNLRFRAVEIYSFLGVPIHVLPLSEISSIKI